MYIGLLEEVESHEQLSHGIGAWGLWLAMPLSVWRQVYGRCGRRRKKREVVLGGVPGVEMGKKGMN